MLLNHFVDCLIHIDVSLNALISSYGFWTYLLLFTVIFCETGLVITPFLPGDSLVFAAGSIAAQPEKPLNIFLLFFLFFLASTLGNQINFWVGRLLGPRIFSSDKFWLLNKKHIQETHEFYKKHGGKTLIFARFLPIIRTFAPFVAGIGTMRPLHFCFYNLISAFLWITSLLALGYFLGSIPIIKEHFSLAIYGIVFLSVLPPILSLGLRAKL